jgi:hypothetical protein
MAYLGQVGREANSASALSVGSAMTIIVAARRYLQSTTG